MKLTDAQRADRALTEADFIPNRGIHRFLRDAGCDVRVWRPSDFPEIERILR